MAFDAKYLGTAARKICAAEHMTPREFDRFDAPVWDGEDCEEAPVLKVRNSKREITITNRDITYAETYL